MADIPLIRNFDDGAVFAFRDRRPIRVEEFLAEAHRLAGLIPDRQYVVNLCSDCRWPRCSAAAPASQLVAAQ